VTCFLIQKRVRKDFSRFDKHMEYLTFFNSRWEPLHLLGAFYLISVALTNSNNTSVSVSKMHPEDIRFTVLEEILFPSQENLSFIYIMI